MKTRILYEDKDILVCFKPAGIAVQSARATEPDVVSELKGYLAGKGKTAVEAPGLMAGVRCGLPSGREPVIWGLSTGWISPFPAFWSFPRTGRPRRS